VLADGSVLNAAITHRFKELNRVNEMRLSSAVREHIEKVFLCHVSLPELDQADVEELVRHYGKEVGVASPISDQREDEKRGDYSDRSSQSLPVESVAPLHALPTEDNRSADQSRTGKDTGSDLLAEDKNRGSETVLTTEELETIRRALKQDFGEGKDVVTPRSVRSFLFKFQLARMMLQSEGVNYDLEALADALSKAVSTARSTGAVPEQEEEHSESEFAWVIRLIA